MNIRSLFFIGILCSPLMAMQQSHMVYSANILFANSTYDLSHISSHTQQALKQYLLSQSPKNGKTTFKSNPSILPPWRALVMVEKWPKVNGQYFGTVQLFDFATMREMLLADPHINAVITDKELTHIKKQESLTQKGKNPS